MRGAATTLAVSTVSGAICTGKEEAKTFRTLVAIAMLAGIVALAAIACGGGDDEAAPPPPAAAAASEPAAATGGAYPVGITRQKRDTIDFTVIVSDGVVSATDGYFSYSRSAAYIPSELTFKVGQTVNFTLQPDNPKATSKHSFTAPSLGISELVKYGQGVSFTYTFDKPGTFHFFDTVDNDMTGTITWDSKSRLVGIRGGLGACPELVEGVPPRYSA